MVERQFPDVWLHNHFFETTTATTKKKEHILHHTALQTKHTLTHKKKWTPPQPHSIVNPAPPQKKTQKTRPNLHTNTKKIAKPLQTRLHDFFEKKNSTPKLHQHPIRHPQSSWICDSSMLGRKSSKKKSPQMVGEIHPWDQIRKKNSPSKPNPRYIYPLSKCWQIYHIKKKTNPSISRPQGANFSRKLKGANFSRKLQGANCFSMSNLQPSNHQWRSRHFLPNRVKAKVTAGLSCAPEILKVP